MNRGEVRSGGREVRKCSKKRGLVGERGKVEMRIIRYVPM